MILLSRLGRALALVAALSLSSCEFQATQSKPRSIFFIGMDVSGSFRKGGNWDDSLDFLSTYIYTHLKGLGGAEVPAALFVAEIGGNIKNEAKTFYPIETFQNRSVKEIEVELKKIFSKVRENANTDFNAFFDSLATQVKERKLLLRPITVVLLSDGKPDFDEGPDEVSRISVKTLETLSRSITIRVLYTDAITASRWQKDVKRTRVKIWTQDAPVMRKWKDPKIMQPELPLEKQDRFFSWLENNVDFGIRVKKND